MNRSMLMQTLHDNMHVRKKSNFIITTGKKGSGKSWLCLGFGQNLEGKEFGMNHVCFSTQQLFEKLDNGEFEPGDVVVLEELGISANNRDAMTRVNKHLSFLAQSIRPARITLMANTITWGLIDPQVKSMADYRINVLGHDVLERTTTFKFLVIDPNDYGGEPLKSHLQFSGVKYTSWSINAPSGGLGELYDKARDDYIKQIYSDGNETFKGRDDVRFGNKKIRVVRKTVEEYANDGLLRYNDLLNEKGQLSTTLIMGLLGIGNPTKAGAVKVVIGHKRNLITNHI